MKEFSQRKQPLYFLNAREEIITVFEGAVLEDLHYIKSVDDIDEIDYGKPYEHSYIL